MNADLIAERGMPAAPDAERAILGSILDNHEHFHEAAVRLSAETFSLDSHRRIFNRMTAMAAEGQAINLLLLMEALRSNRELESIGGAAYLASLTEGLPRRNSVEPLVGIVREKAMLREAIAIAQDLSLRALDQQETAQDLIADADRRLLTIAAETAQETATLGQQTLSEMNLLQRQMDGKSVRLLTTGIAGLDMLMGGLAFREVAFLAARPGQGKTWLICQLIWRYCSQGIPCHFFTIEMQAGALLRRLWAMVSGVSYRRLREGLLSPAEIQQVNAAAGEVAEWPLILDDSSALSTDQLIAKSRISKRKHGTQFFALDYLQKMRFTRDVKFRHIDVSDAAVGIARMTKEEDVVFLAVSSLTRHGERGSTTAPTLGDFRQSGDIEYEASTVIFIHRERDPQTEKFVDEGELIVAKSRNADLGAIRARFNPQTLMFEEVIGDHHV